MGRKGKQIAESGSESDVPRRQPKKQKQSKEAAEKQAQKPKPTPAQRMRRMSTMAITSTRWAHHQTLRDLGIFDEVSYLMERMGLTGLFNMAHQVHAEETKQFLASLAFYDDTSLDVEDENRGYLTFKIHGKDHKITLAQLNMVFLFPTGGRASHLKLTAMEAQGVWQLIAQGDYVKGVSKSASIRHPAIRYAHVFLTSTLFERRERGGVKEEELALLIEGIKGNLATNAFGEEIRGLPVGLHYASYLAYRLVAYQEWVMSNKDSKPQLGIGGLITPILQAVGAEIRPAVNPIPVTHVDIPWLSAKRFLAGRVRRSYGYKFLMGGEAKIILLPNQGQTAFTTREHVLFQPRAFLLHDPTREGRLQTIPLTRPDPPSEHDEEEEEQGPEVVYGSKRYDFEPYTEAISGRALKAAHEHIGLLQRFVKWQSKTIKKLYKKVTKQGKKLKTQGKLINDLMMERGSHSRMEEGDNAAWEMDLATSRAEATGPSTRGEGSSRNKEKAPLSPSSSGSGNPCYSMGSSSSSPSN